MVMWTLDRAAAVPAWLPAPADPACVLAFSTRQGGVSEPPWDTLNLGYSGGDRSESVLENRRRLTLSQGLHPANLATAGQVHGTTLRHVTHPGHEPACDALLTLTPGLALAVATADCMSLLYTVPGAIAAAHAGWRGAAAGLPATILHALTVAAGAPASAARVVLGPCIRGCCYEVGPEVARRFPASAVRNQEGRLYLDLPGAARLQLLEAGLSPEAFEDTGACTACERYWYFSHRRDAGQTGRHWGLAALRSGRPAPPERGYGGGL
jgi:YfiH family protein